MPMSALPRQEPLPSPVFHQGAYNHYRLFASTKKGGAAVRINIDWFTDSTSPTAPSSAALPDAPPLPVLPIPYAPGLVGRRLHFFWQNWQAIQANEWVVSILWDNYFLPFDSAPVLTTDPPSCSYSGTHPLFQDMSHHIQLLLDKQAIEEIPRSTPGFYSRIFLALKKSGNWRPVIDLGTLNRFLRSPHFRMETSASIMRSLQPGHWATSLDFKDDFFHVPVAPAHRHYLSFWFDHHYFRFRALPFSLATSPYLFTRLVKAVGAFARSQGLSLLLYLDNWNISAPSAPACTAWTSWLLTLSEPLGLVVNTDRCELVPSQCFVFVGIDFDLANGTARLAPHRVQNLLLSLQTFTSLRPPPSHQVAATSQPYDFPGETHSAGPSPRAPPSVRSQGQLGPVIGPPLYIGTHTTGRPLCSGGVPRSTCYRGPPTPPLPQLQLFTDASTKAWGPHLTSHQTSGMWSPQQRSLHINNLELLAVHLALQHFLPLVIYKVAIVMTDNTTVVGQIKNQGGTHSWSLYRQTVLLLEWVDSKRITLVLHHILGHLNVVADRLSQWHQTINSEWTLSQQILHHV